MTSPKKSFVLVVLDGWGHREEREHNAILAAHTPVWNHLWRDYPHGLVLSSGEESACLTAKWATPKSAT